MIINSNSNDAYIIQFEIEHNMIQNLIKKIQLSNQIEIERERVIQRVRYICFYWYLINHEHEKKRI